MVEFEVWGLGVRFAWGTHPAFRNRAWVRTWSEGRLRTLTLFSSRKNSGYVGYPSATCVPRGAHPKTPMPPKNQTKAKNQILNG